MTLGFGILLTVAVLARAEPLRVTTWNLRLFPGGGAANPTAEIESRNLEQAAAVLRQLDADVVVLQEVRDRAAAGQLARALGGDRYHVNLCTELSDYPGAAPGRRQIAVLSRWPADAAWQEAWRGDGKVVPPGGYGFVLLPTASGPVGVFAVHLKNNVTRGAFERENQLNILKRELATEQLLQAVNSLPSRLTNPPANLILAGNFNTTADQERYVSEQTLRVLQEAGFASGFENIPPAQRITCPGRGRYADVTFDYVLARGAAHLQSPAVLATDVSDHHPVTASLRLAPIAAPIPRLPVPVPLPRTSPFWRVALLVAMLLMLAMVFQVVRQWRRQTAEAEAEDWVIEPGLGVRASRKQELAETPLGARERKLLREGLIPQLARAMTNRLTQALLSQRAQLLDAHRTGADQVTEIEARLARIQSQIQERINGYEQRIAELEQEIRRRETERARLLQQQPAPQLREDSPAHEDATARL